MRDPFRFVQTLVLAWHARHRKNRVIQVQSRSIDGLAQLFRAKLGMGRQFQATDHQLYLVCKISRNAIKLTPRILVGARRIHKAMGAVVYSTWRDYGGPSKKPGERGASSEES